MITYKASSQYKDFGPERLADGRGWLSNVLTGDLEHIIIDSDTPIRTLLIRNGFCEFPDGRDWIWHHRVATIHFPNLSGKHTYTLRDDKSGQEIVLPDTSQHIVLEILSIYPSTRFNVVGIQQITPV